MTVKSETLKITLSQDGPAARMATVQKVVDSKVDFVEPGKVICSFRHSVVAHTGGQSSKPHLIHLREQTDPPPAQFASGVSMVMPNTLQCLDDPAAFQRGDPLFKTLGIRGGGTSTGVSPTAKATSAPVTIVPAALGIANAAPHSTAARNSRTLPDQKRPVSQSSAFGEKLALPSLARRRNSRGSSAMFVARSASDGVVQHPLLSR